MTSRQGYLMRHYMAENDEKIKIPENFRAFTDQNISWSLCAGVKIYRNSKCRIKIIGSYLWFSLYRAL